MFDEFDFDSPLFIICASIVLGTIVGHLYLPLRLSLIGELKRTTILSVEIRKEYQSSGPGTGAWYDQPFYLVQGIPEAIPSKYTDLKIGQNVNILSNKNIPLVVILPYGTSIFSILYSLGSYLYPIFTFLVLSGLLVGLTIRIGLFIKYLLDQIVKLWASEFEQEMRPLGALLAFTDFLSQVVAVFVGISIVCFAFYLFVQAIFLVERSGAFLAGNAILITCIAIFSRAPESIVDLILKIRNQTIWKDILTIGRNMIAIVAGCTFLIKAFSFLFLTDIKQYGTIQDVIINLASYLID